MTGKSSLFSVLDTVSGLARHIDFVCDKSTNEFSVMPDTQLALTRRGTALFTSIFILKKKIEEQFWEDFQSAFDRYMSADREVMRCLQTLHELSRHRGGLFTILSNSRFVRRIKELLTVVGESNTDRRSSSAKWYWNNVEQLLGRRLDYKVIDYGEMSTKSVNDARDHLVKVLSIMAGAADDLNELGYITGYTVPRGDSFRRIIVYAEF